MSDDAPLSSATLAQLYLAQGHHERAAAILDELVRRDPFDGAALVLRERMASPCGRLSGEVVGDEVRVVFDVPLGAGEGPFHVLLATAGLSGRDRAIRVTSRPCPSHVGKLVFPRPAGPGSGELALACMRNGQPIILACRRLPSWS